MHYFFLTGSKSFDHESSDANMLGTLRSILGKEHD